jgi:hypothetical protein
LASAVTRNPTDLSKSVRSGGAAFPMSPLICSPAAAEMGRRRLAQHQPRAGLAQSAPRPYVAAEEGVSPLAPGISTAPQLKTGFRQSGIRPGKAPAPAPAPRGPSGIKIEDRIGVQAPAEVIWEILANLSGWSDWNPLYPKVAGELRIGSRLTLTLALEGEADQEIQPVIVDWVPLDQIHWRLSVGGGLVRTIRYIEIETLTETGCIVSNGEIFSGLLAGMVVKPRRGRIRRGFLAMNEALKTRAEAAWRAAAPAPG